MKLSKLIPVVMIPAFAAIGCAAPSSDDGQAATGADLTASAGFNFTAAVGAFEVGGETLCTATLVDVDAGAQLGGVSLSGRQIVLGEACLGRIGNYVGGGVFVTAAGGVSVRTPVAAIDLSGAASTGFAVGILTESVHGVHPLKPFVGVSAGVGAGIHTATVLTTNSHGVQVGAAVEVEVGASFELRTQCTDFRFKAALEVGAGAELSVGEITGAAAIVNVGGELQFAASINGECIAHQIEKVLVLPLEAADAVLEGFADIGAGKTLAVYDLPNGTTTVRVRFPARASSVRLNAVGFLSATSQDGSTCSALLGPCTLQPAAGFRAGQVINVSIDTGLPSLTGHHHVLVSVPE